MAGDYAVRLASTEATTLQSHISDKLAAPQAAEKKVVKARARVRAITLFLEEEQTSTTALEAEATTATLQLPSATASSSVPQPPTSASDAAIVPMLHARPAGYIMFAPLSRLF
jgi:hypothetical protein